MGEVAALVALAGAGLAHCRAVVTGQEGLFLGLAGAGLAGGLMHCTGMCGPFVLSFVTTRLEAVPAARMRERTRWLGALLLGYHLGRLTTYMTLGALAGGVAGLIARGLDGVSSLLMLAAAGVFVVQALGRLGVPLPRWRRGAPSQGSPPVLGRLLPRAGRGYAVGVLLGFLPCGLLYGAIAAAAASGSALGGALGMAAFTLGTLPGLWAIGLIGHVVSQRWKTTVSRWAPGLLLLNAGVLVWLAL